MKHIRTMITISAALVFAVEVDAQLRFTWEENGHEYFVSEEMMTWQEAVVYAESFGGHLVTIASSDEQAWLVETVLDYGNAVDFDGCCLFVWIGLTDEQAEGDWVWINGEAVTFTSWLAGEPNNASVSPTGEDYAALGSLTPGTPNGWGWYDYPSPMYLQGDQRLYAIVEISHCLADTNYDGSLTPADFSSWIAAFVLQQPACDQNDDGLCTPADFSAWVANYNAGC